MSVASLHILILIIAANSAPILLARVLEDTLAHPIDGGRTFFDGRPILGTSKTWRGLLAAVAVCIILAPWLGYSMLTGAAVAALAMAGDLISSFSKRRMGMVSSSQAFLLDQVPESLLPPLVLKPLFGFTWLDIGLVVVMFTVLEVILSVIFYWLGVRKRPY